MVSYTLNLNPPSQLIGSQFNLFLFPIPMIQTKKIRNPAAPRAHSTAHSYLLLSSAVSLATSEPPATTSTSLLSLLCSSAAGHRKRNSHHPPSLLFFLHSLQWTYRRTSLAASSRRQNLLKAQARSFVRNSERLNGDFSPDMLFTFVCANCILNQLFSF